MQMLNELFDLVYQYGPYFLVIAFGIASVWVAIDEKIKTSQLLIILSGASILFIFSLWLFVV